MGVLIPNDAECEPAAPPDCGYLFEMGEAILNAAYGGLAGYEIIDGPCAGNLDLVVSLGPPAADLCDVLFAWLESYSADARSTQRALDSANGQLVGAAWVASWQVELWEAAYPTVEVEGQMMVRLPAPGALHEINRLVYGHGYSMYHSLIEANSSGDLYPGTECERLSIGPLTPLTPQGGCAGWSFKVAGAVPSFG